MKKDIFPLYKDNKEKKDQRRRVEPSESSVKFMGRNEWKSEREHTRFIQDCDSLVPRKKPREKKDCVYKQKTVRRYQKRNTLEGVILYILTTQKYDGSVDNKFVWNTEKLRLQHIKVVLYKRVVRREMGSTLNWIVIGRTERKSSRERQTWKGILGFRYLIGTYKRFPFTI